MAVPKRRTSRSRQGMRRSHLKVAVPNVVYCRKCGQPKLPHRACSRCGYYREGITVPVASEEKKEG